MPITAGYHRSEDAKAQRSLAREPNGKALTDTDGPQAALSRATDGPRDAPCNRGRNADGSRRGERNSDSGTGSGRGTDGDASTDSTPEGA